MFDTKKMNSEALLGLLWAAKYVSRLGIVCGGHAARLLGGSSCSPDNIWVQCRCSGCKEREPKPYDEGGNVCTLTEFSQHACGKEPAMKLFRVIQPGALRDPVPLLDWLRAANEHLGGEMLHRRQLCVFWSGLGDSTADAANQWRSATIRKIDKETGACEVKYHDDRRKYSRAFLYLPLAVVHFARCPPSPGAPPRIVAEGRTPLPAVLLRSADLQPPSSSPSPPPQGPATPPPAADQVAAQPSDSRTEAPTAVPPPKPAAATPTADLPAAPEAAAAEPAAEDAADVYSGQGGPATQGALFTAGAKRSWGGQDHSQPRSNAGQASPQLHNRHHHQQQAPCFGRLSSSNNQAAGEEYPARPLPACPPAKMPRISGFSDSGPVEEQAETAFLETPLTATSVGVPEPPCTAAVSATPFAAYGPALETLESDPWVDDEMEPLLTFCLEVLAPGGSGTAAAGSGSSSGFGGGNAPVSHETPRQVLTARSYPASQHGGSYGALPPPPQPPPYGTVFTQLPYSACCDQQAPLLSRTSVSHSGSCSCSATPVLIGATNDSPQSALSPRASFVQQPSTVAAATGGSGVGGGGRVAQAPPAAWCAPAAPTGGMATAAQAASLPAPLPQPLCGAPLQGSLHQGALLDAQTAAALRDGLRTPDLTLDELAGLKSEPQPQADYTAVEQHWPLPSAWTQSAATATATAASQQPCGPSSLQPTQAALRGPSHAGWSGASLGSSCSAIAAPAPVSAPHARWSTTFDSTAATSWPARSTGAAAATTTAAPNPYGATLDTFGCVPPRMYDSRSMTAGDFVLHAPRPSSGMGATTGLLDAWV